MESFTGKVAVVTGAGSGIGWALAERFAAEGIKVVVADVEAAAERPEALALHERLRAGVANYGKPPSEIADHVLRAIREERFYILPHTEFDGLVRDRMENILGRTDPQVRRF